ncbi:FkbM family methyltransferase [Planktothrix paucivesiculata]|uniref:Methyltransferase, FkbM family n=1 Tax=Planktothrix paucivesiculata PCC 9631 TaxID=671071 RepID=A0A7Z9BZ32_9CYAN|nr:FkbM family methyltransferase [Planktothrix paucivesiculata]VXD24799.1 Methyltransferase, FkbM family [Planktothrix paucivesiculata PCC 9631]
MKQQLLGGLIGGLALSLRDKFDIFNMAFSYPERVGTVANDQMATKLVTTICQSHKTFVDVGAHIGSVISEVANTDSTIKIVAIEAIPEKIVKLRRKFPFIELHDCAVGESRGEVSFFVHLKQSGYSSLRRPVSLNELETYEIKVPIKRLDEIVLSNDIDVIKIDVEGAELGVLRGSTKILNENRPTIMFESGPQLDDDLGYTKEELYEFFFSSDYVVLIPNRVAHNDFGLSKDGFIESHLYPRRTTNYFAIPKERRIEIRDRARSILKILVP